ncbi:protein-glutamate methylesterase/protein-glutamine glutaminase [Calycomorphotria hydatis]|uniref:Protein-glutamate methylesterase/protein-glutamine glutaminase n=1 Tax=Calycomorphotria hydatis TaxID=2528027 RepID=A0A517T7B3_9PLAN|nr:chemotaxis response regulator protein-glutamate methylesterase [Calycomorphotria hydatis]QDT64257.1 Chemotaxis response regulator protein-glutamate methylesterase [Calycomorphotria hydatis]
MSLREIQVLVVDDSAVIRGLISRVLESDPRIGVAGSAMNGEAALRWLDRNSADVVVLDVEMPVMDGLTALKEIQKLHPQVRVIMASSLTYKGADTTVQALMLGAAGCVAKPVAGSKAHSIEQLAKELIELVTCLAPTEATSTSTQQSIAPVRVTGTSTSPEAIVVGASTGGPRALSEFLSGLSPAVTQPIFIVQHMPPLFTPMLAKRLGDDTGRDAKEAAGGEIVSSGQLYVAPGGKHLELTRNSGGQVVTRLTESPEEHYCRPSVNPLFRTAAKVYQSSLLGVMLTGMGEDGIEGTQELVRHGGVMIAQDEASSVVWGMPGAVCRAGLASKTLPLHEISTMVEHLCCRKVTV